MTKPAGDLREERGRVRTDDGHSIEWRSAGAGDTTVLLVHGITLNGGIWQRQVRDLAGAGLRVVTVDQRGHGDSSPIHASVHPHRLGADLDCVLEELDLVDVVVCGHSLGGIAALSLLAGGSSGAERVRGAVLLSTTGTARFVSHVTQMNAVVGPLERLLYRTVPRWLPTPVRMVVRPKPIGRSIMRLAFGRGAERGDVAVTEELFATTAHRTVRHLFDGLLDWHLLDSLGSVSVPTLVVCGTRDLITPLPLSRHLHRRLPASELYVVPGGGHMLMMERPALVSDLLADFAHRTRRRRPVAVEAV